MNMKYYEQQLKLYNQKAATVGINFHDYRMIRQYINELDFLLPKIQENQSNDFFSDLEETCRQLQIDFWNLAYGYEQVALRISRNAFLMKNTSLVHLAYTNNESSKIRHRSIDSYLFLCQFHEESHPSMTVCSSSNSFYCFSCGKVENPIDFLQLVEHMSKKEAVSFLKSIYLIDREASEVEENPLLIKYREALFSDGYYDLLEEGKRKAMEKEDSYRKLYALIRYQEQIDTRARVREKRTLYYEDSYPKEKVYKLPH